MAAKVSYISCLPSEYAPGNILDSAFVPRNSDDLHLPRDARHDNVTPTQTRRSPAFSYISKDFRDESTSRAILKLAKNFQT